MIGAEQKRAERSWGGGSEPVGGPRLGTGCSGKRPAVAWAQAVVWGDRKGAELEVPDSEGL